MLGMASSSAPPATPDLVGPQDIAQPSVPTGIDTVLYDELASWMGDDWPVYNNCLDK